MKKSRYIRSVMTMVFNWTDAGSTSSVLLSSEGDDQLEVLMHHVTALNDLLPREQTPASSSSSSTSSSPSQPPPASEARNHGEH